MKTQLQARVITYTNATFTFTGTEASAVVSAVRAHQDMKAKGTLQGALQEYPIQIPYTSVMQVMYKTEQVESSTEDDNCKVQIPAEEVSLKIAGGQELSGNTLITIVLGDTSINGKYGDVTFTNGRAEVIPVSPGNTLNITGLANGITYTIDGNVEATEGSLTGTTPAEVLLITGGGD